jgi:hypothetical protein
VSIDQPAETPTSEQDFHPPGALHHIDVVGDAVLQITALSQFLAENFPDEIALSNVQQRETPAATAIRLLLGVVANAPIAEHERCQDSYCNKRRNHQDQHGWVQSDGRRTD